MSGKILICKFIICILPCPIGYDRNGSFWLHVGNKSIMWRDFLFGVVLRDYVEFCVGMANSSEHFFRVKVYVESDVVFLMPQFHI